MTPVRQFTRDEALSMWSRLVAGWADHLDSSGARLMIDGVTNRHDAGGSYEGVTRMLWGLGGWLSVPGRPTTVTWRGKNYDVLALTRQALLSGTDPDSSGYWEIPSVRGASDQRTVESGQVAFALWQTRTHIWSHLSSEERHRIIAWLDSVSARPPEWRSNWSLFWALNHQVRAALDREHDATLVPSVLDYLDTVYCGNGWFDDGPVAGTNHFDDYNLWVFSSHVLALVQIKPDLIVQRPELLERVRLQMQHAPYFFAADGAYTEYGRSLSYKFARLGALVWAYQAGIWPHSAGMLKRLVGRHLRWYQDRGAVNENGTLRQSLTGEGSLDVRETYVSTGATYWAMQAFGALWSLSDDDLFWSVEEEPLPVENGDFTKTFPEPGFVLVGTRATGAVQRFTSHSHHSPSKYSKFHYTTAAPFSVGLHEGRQLPDGMLCLSEGESRGHKDIVIQSAIGESSWLRFRYSQVVGATTHWVETTIIPLGEAHIRLHQVTLDPATVVPVHGIEGAAPLGYPAGATPASGFDGSTSWASNDQVMVAIAAHSGYVRAGRPSAFGAGNANSVFGFQVTPWLETPNLISGALLINAVHIGSVLPDPGSLADNLISAQLDDAGFWNLETADGTLLEIPPLPRA